MSTCAEKRCPKNNLCTNTAQGAQCIPQTTDETQSVLITTADLTPIFGAKDTSLTKDNIVMVHLQPSFLSLTIGVPLAIALCGLLLAVIACIIIGACVWNRDRPKRNNDKNDSPRVEDEGNPYTLENSTMWSTYEPISSLRKNGGLPQQPLTPRRESLDSYGLQLFGEKKFERNSLKEKVREINSAQSTPVYQRYSESPSRHDPMTITAPLLYSQSPKGAIAGKKGTSVLPPRPQPGSLVTYPTLLRPIFYQFPQALRVNRKESLSGQSPYAIISDTKKNE